MQYFIFIISRLVHFFQYISSCLTIRFDNISMTSLVFSNQLCRFYCLTFNFSVKIYRSIVKRTLVLLTAIIICIVSTLRFYIFQRRQNTIF